jgi:cation diffusion facilitator CzcD-associated flavoprotein CzcO
VGRRPLANLLRERHKLGGFVHEAKILVSAVGGYTNPKFSALLGIETFQSPVVHTAQWDQDYG